MEERNVRKKIRKQVYLEPEQNDRIKKIASTRQWTEAEVIRKAIDAYIEELAQKDPLLDLFDLIEANPVDGSVEHDRYIYGNQ